jgi:hypothetical protein
VALLAGRIDGIRARIIAGGTDELSPAHAARVEALVLPRAGQQTYVALGIAVGKAVLRVDPDGAIRRRKRAEKRARVERWREYDGTGALAGRNLPPGDTLAADQALTDLALELREAGLDGSLDYLRATALIDRITGRDSRVLPGDQGVRDTAPVLPLPTQMLTTRTGRTGTTGPAWTRTSWPSGTPWPRRAREAAPAGADTGATAAGATQAAGYARHPRRTYPANPAGQPGRAAVDGVTPGSRLGST